MIISMDKQYRTRDGREVRIYAVDGGGNSKVHGAILEGDGWIATTWASTGIKSGFVYTGEEDLIEVKPRIQREYWVNVFKGTERPAIHITKLNADTYAFERIACVKITIDCEEGEGL